MPWSAPGEGADSLDVGTREADAVQVLTTAGWTGPYLDYHRPEGALRIRVAGIATVERIRTLYFEQPRDIRRVWNYVREVGPAEVVRKIRSRSNESERNEKYLWIGGGVVVESDDPTWDAKPVLFVAPAHPKGVERIVLPPELVRPVDDVALGERLTAHDGPPGLGEAPADALGADRDALVGWSPYSGAAVPHLEANRTLKSAERWFSLGSENPPTDEGPVWPGTSPISETAPPGTPAADVAADTLSCTVFGYGHYAKISLIPNLHGRLRVDRVHELDPTQLGTGPHPFTVDSSPVLREPMDVAFLAGFHHTHAPLATEALRQGAHVVIEKPIATTRDQLADLVAAMEGAEGSVHIGFHKRFQSFNAWAHEDLDATPGDPISYYCIAYEVPLPEHHWYRWPNSGSRLLSNGCHWVDHFLYLNDFVAVRSAGVTALPSGDISAHVVLENDAAFHMILTDQGGSRIGVQDHIELRWRDRTVRIRNATHYESEDDRRVIRRSSENKANAYPTMYSTISAAIAEGRSGDTAVSVERSAGTVLDLEERLIALIGGGP